MKPLVVVRAWRSSTRSWRLLAMVAYPITPRQGVTLSVGSGGNHGAGTDADAISVAYQVAWGGG